MRNVEWIEVQPFHQLGAFKWKALNLDYKHAKTSTLPPGLIHHVLGQFRAVYEVELLGNSRELALENKNFVERHRLYVFFTFDGHFEACVRVFDFEAMFGPWAEIFSINESAFEYIPRSEDPGLRALQERIKSSISFEFQRSFHKTLMEVEK